MREKQEGQAHELELTRLEVEQAKSEGVRSNRSGTDVWLPERVKIKDLRQTFHLADIGLFLFTFESSYEPTGFARED